MLELYAKIGGASTLSVYGERQITAVRLLDACFSFAFDASWSEFPYGQVSYRSHPSSSSPG